jgi:hypothetical protein
MLRYLAKEKRNDRSENFKKQESMISKQARLLPDAVNTIIPASTKGRRMTYRLFRSIEETDMSIFTIPPNIFA